MSWFIDFPIPASPFPISYRSKILSLGSCFAESIGSKMALSKFDVLVNPFGTIFHPLNLADLLNHTVLDKPLDSERILIRDGLFFHYSTHSELVGNTREELIGQIKNRLNLTRTYLEHGTHLILTLGSAWIYEHRQLGRVANCHKQPHHIFARSLSGLDEMEFSLKSALDNCLRIFPNLKVILTLSPVRHIKEGIPENQLSKSLLRVLCGNLEREMESVSYFPAYEIMMDELRDYRFYQSDLIHPSDQAVTYIWEKWQQSVFEADTREKVSEIKKIQQELGHRPFNPHSETHRIFLQNLLAKLERLTNEFDFSEEIQLIRSKLSS